MEIESNSKIAFLDTSVYREPNGRLTTSVYRKSTPTDQYLMYDSHHPQSVKCSIVKCLHDRAKRLVTKPSVIAGEKKHLSSVLVCNRYPSSFVQKITKGRTTPRREPVAELKFTVQGVSESLRLQSLIFAGEQWQSETCFLKPPALNSIALRILMAETLEETLNKQKTSVFVRQIFDIERFSRKQKIKKRQAHCSCPWSKRARQRRTHKFTCLEYDWRV